MPRYDYSCRGCGHDFEVTHSMNEKPSITCPLCGGNAKKIISACGIIVRNTNARIRVCDHITRTGEAKQDLFENYGVENVSPVGGNTMLGVYNDIKSRGSEVRESMQKKREETENKRVSKSREWKKTALKRAPERSRVMSEKKAQERAAKRAISL